MVITMVDVIRSDLSRVFAIENGAGAGNAPIYEGLWRAGALSEDQGNTNLIRVPSATQRGKFDVVNKYTGAPGTPKLDVVARYTMDLSDLLRLVHKQCDTDLQIHFGLCGSPQDYKEGWDKVVILENARGQSYTTDELGALDQDETKPVNETVPFEGERFYEIKPLGIQKVLDTEVLEEIMDIAICDSPSCGACGIPSDGTSVFFAVEKSSGGSPGLLPHVVYSKDSGATGGLSVITPMAANEVPTGIDCVGTNTVVVAPLALGLYYADSSDLLDDIETWVKVTTGFNANGGPNDIYSANPSYTWIVGENGYIYFTDDPTNGVTVQDSGSATGEDLLAITGFDINNLVAVGENNALVYTNNGGSTWQAITGPAVGINLNCVAMRTKTEWFVGTADGRLYYTPDSGTHWYEKSFPGNGSGSVTDIKFVTNSVGYMTHTTTAPAGRLLRTISGGYQWYVLPEGHATIPANKGLNAIAVNLDPNVVYAGGLSTVGTDGVLLKGA